MKKQDVLIVGAGACGLMAALELAKNGKKVVIREARDRIGGRIWPLPEDEWGYSAQGGAEFVHGNAPLTKSMVKEAGLTLIKTRTNVWDARDGKLMISGWPLPNQDVLQEKLRELKEDMPISEFLERYLADDKYAELRRQITRLVEGYDAADADRISTFTLRELSGKEWLQYRIKEGYGALLNFLESKCKENGIKIYLNSPVKEVRINNEEKVIVTVPLPVIKTISFSPPIPHKLEAASKIGFGGIIKILLRFKNKWWVDALRKDFSEMDFIFSDETISTWWTQYAEEVPVLTGWLAGPKSRRFVNSSAKEIIEAALTSLSNIFKTNKQFLKEQLVTAKAINWLADPCARGAYSYWTLESDEAAAELRKPVANKLFFAGEALCTGQDTATVEGALQSGLEVAGKVISI